MNPKKQKSKTHRKEATAPDPKVIEFRAAVAALQAAAERISRALDTIHGPVGSATLAGAARTGLVLSLIYAATIHGKFDDLEPSLTVEPDTDSEDAIADAMCDLAALARISGLDEEDAFGRRSIYFEEFKKPASYGKVAVPRATDPRV